jgi:hypothetical protein
VKVDFGERPDFSLFIESEFEYVEKDRNLRISGTPFDDSMREMDNLLGKEVLTAFADEDGSLSVTFAGGERLVCTADENYQAWRITSPDGFRVVSVASGGLMIWDRPQDGS